MTQSNNNENTKDSKLSEPTYGNFDIICPYCFKKFHTDEVVFRASHNSSSGKLAQTFDKELNDYRAKFKGEAVGKLNVVIDSKAISEENRIFDGNNVLIGIKDSEGKETKDRLCLYCHNSLPKTAGKHPTDIISIVGDTKVGKSVYIAILIRLLREKTADSFGAVCVPTNTEIEDRFMRNFERTIFERNLMPDHTQKEMKQEPLIFEFRFKDRNKPSALLVFFDMAGEGILDQDYLDIYANHIKNSTGMMFLLDPLQIDTIRPKILLKIKSDESRLKKQESLDAQENLIEDDDFTRGPLSGLVALNDNFIGNAKDGRTKIPTAIVLTKSDLLEYLKEEDYFYNNSNTLIDIDHEGFLNISEIDNINGEVKNFLEKICKNFKNYADMLFEDCAYFAVSALGHNPIDSKVSFTINPRRVCEPFLWLLWKLGYIEGKRKLEFKKRFFKIYSKIKSTPQKIRRWFNFSV